MARNPVSDSDLELLEAAKRVKKKSEPATMTNSNGAVSVRAVATVASISLTVAGLMMVVHAQLVVPAILLQVDGYIDNAIERHALQPHVGAMESTQWISFRSEILARFDKLDSRLRELETGK